MPHGDAACKVVFEHVHLHYFSPAGETHALSDINLGVRAGEFITIVGQSGCGKSTLLSLLCGLIAPTQGRVLIDGVPVSGPSRKIGFMLQQDSLFEWRSVLDNVLLGAEIHGQDPAVARARAEALLERYKLADFKHHFPRQLSGGMRQRVALARTMCLEPDILLLDEPFSALDFQIRLTLADEIASIIRSERKTAIMVTHDISEAISMADRVIVLSARPGRVKAEYPVVFASHGPNRPSPFEVRETPEYHELFRLLWNGIGGHQV
ncbi:MAG: ABC transporter ATP-binding protein [Burkholderiaceae bacterium]